MSRVTVRGCILLHMQVVVIISWELLLEHPPTNCSVGVQSRVGWNLRLALLICAFHTLKCLLTALPTGPNCILWAKTKIWLASFLLEFSLNCCCCSKLSSFCFILMFYSTWIWDLGSLDDTSIGNIVQFYIKGLNHWCVSRFTEEFYASRICLALAPDMLCEAEECWLSRNVFHFHPS